MNPFNSWYTLHVKSQRREREKERIKKKMLEKKKSLLYVLYKSNQNFFSIKISISSKIDFFFFVPDNVIIGKIFFVSVSILYIYTYNDREYVVFVSSSQLFFFFLCFVFMHVIIDKACMYTLYVYAVCDHTSDTTETF